MNDSIKPLCETIRDAGFCFIPAAAASSLVEISSADWRRFAASWNDMPMDTYMADGGRYRRRRHATLSMSANTRWPNSSRIKRITRAAITTR